MADYKTDREWSNQFIPTIKAIVGRHILTETTFEVDTQQAADLMVLYAKGITIACRIRRTGFSHFANEFTLRLARESGAKTEFAKIIEGWADWMFYGHAKHNDEPEIALWHLLNLESFRTQFAKNRIELRHGRGSNRDGTSFAWFDIGSFLPEPPLVIASSSRASPVPQESPRVAATTPEASNVIPFPEITFESLLKFIRDSQPERCFTKWMQVYTDLQRIWSLVGQQHNFRKLFKQNTK